MKTPVVWIEISVSNFEKAVTFYENVFEKKLEIRGVLNNRIALFNEDDFGMKISLNQVDNYTGSNGIKPFFYVNIIREVIERVIEFGGQIVIPPTLLKQLNKEGDLIIGSNLIDNEVGYYSEIIDSEGNHLCLYAHS